MAESTKYKTGRIPVIALDFDSRNQAKKRELLVDYDKGKLYVVSPEDNSIYIDITQKVIEEFKDNSDLSDFVVKIDGVGTYNLGAILNNLYNSRINLIENEDFQYEAPKLAFDSKSITVYDRMASVNGFVAAPDGTAPVKENGIISWKPFLDEDLDNRVKRLEASAPPDQNQFTELKNKVNQLSISADVVKELPAIKELANNNLSKIEAIQENIKVLTNGQDYSADINNLKSSINNATNDINNLKVLTSDYGDIKTKVNGFDTSINSNKTNITDLTSRISTLEGLDLDTRVTANNTAIVDSNKKISKNSSDLSDLKSNLDTYKQSTTKSIADLTSEINGFTNTKDDLINQMSTVTDTVNKLNKTITDMPQSLTQDNVNRLISNALSEPNNNIASNTSKIEELTNNLNSIQTNFSPVSEAVSKVTADFNNHKNNGVLDHPDGSVTTSKLNDAAVTEAKLADKSVTGSKLGDDISPILTKTFTGSYSDLTELTVNDGSTQSITTTNNSIIIASSNNKTGIIAATVNNVDKDKVITLTVRAKYTGTPLSAASGASVADEDIDSNDLPAPNLTVNVTNTDNNFTGSVVIPCNKTTVIVMKDKKIYRL